MNFWELSEGEVAICKNRRLQIEAFRIFLRALGPGLTKKHCCRNIFAEATISQRVAARETCCVSKFCLLETRKWLGIKGLANLRNIVTGKHCCGCKCFQVYPREKQIFRSKLFLPRSKKMLLNQIKNISCFVCFQNETYVSSTSHSRKQWEETVHFPQHCS